MQTDINMGKQEKIDLKQYSDELKMKALDEYNRQLKQEFAKFNKDGKDKNENNNFGYTQRLIKNLTENVLISVKNLQCLFFYQITNQEIVKIGFRLGELQFCSSKEGQKYQKERGDSSNYNKTKSKNNSFIKKTIKIDDISLSFEFYDSFFDQQTTEENSIALPQVTRFNKFKKKEQNQQQNYQHSKSDNHILKNLDMIIQVNFDFASKQLIDIDMTVSPVLFYFKQHQIRLFLKSLNQISQYNQERPTQRPKHDKNAKKDIKIPATLDNTAVQWWKYCITKVMKQINYTGQAETNSYDKVFQNFTSEKAKRYKHNFILDKILQQSLSSKEVKFQQQYEKDQILSDILLLRQVSLFKYEICAKNLLQTKNEKKFEQAKRYFQQILPKQNMDQIVKMVSQTVGPSNQNGKSEEQEENEFIEEVGENNYEEEDEENEEFKYNLKQGENKGFKIELALHVTSFDILIQENDVLKDIKNLHNQTEMFKQQLRKQRDLKKQVLQHITKNFIEQLSNQGVNQSKNKMNQEYQLDNDLDNSELSDPIYSNLLEENEAWTLENIKKQKEKQNIKLLLHFQIENILVHYSKSSGNSWIQTQLQSVTVFDMHQINCNYQKFLSISEGIQVELKSEAAFKDEKKQFNTQKLMQQIEVHNYVDVNVKSIDFTFTKPFIERLISLSQLILFNPDDIGKKQEKERKQSDQQLKTKLFNKFLLPKVTYTQLSNITINIEKINIYLPQNYMTQSEMFVFQIKNLQLFKIEHESLRLDKKYTQMFNEFNFEDQKKVFPILISLDCFRMLMVKDYGWEESENIFLINYKNLQQQYKENINEDEEAKSQQENHYFQKYGKQQQQSQMETIMETLMVNIRIDSKENYINIGSYQNLKQDDPRYQNYKYQKKVYPTNSYMKLSLPYLVMNLSISQMFQLQYFVNMWTSQGQNIFQTLYYQKSNNRQQENQENNDNQQEKSQNYNIQMLDSYEIDYTQIKQYLKEFVMNQVSIQIDGFVFNLLANSQESFSKYENNFHSNNILSLYMQGIYFKQTETFFHTSQQIAIEQLLVQNRNCYDLELLQQLKDLAGLMLNQSDYQKQKKMQEKSKGKYWQTQQNEYEIKHNNKFDQSQEQGLNLNKDPLFQGDQSENEMYDCFSEDEQNSNFNQVQKPSQNLKGQQEVDQNNFLQQALTKNQNDQHLTEKANQRFKEQQYKKQEKRSNNKQERNNHVYENNVKDLPHYEPQWQIQLEDKSKKTSFKSQHSGLNKCEKCFGKNSQSNRLLVNFQNPNKVVQKKKQQEKQKQQKNQRFQEQSFEQQFKGGLRNYPEMGNKYNNNDFGIYGYNQRSNSNSNSNSNFNNNNFSYNQNNSKDEIYEDNDNQNKNNQQEEPNFDIFIDIQQYESNEYFKAFKEVKQEKEISVDLNDLILTIDPDIFKQLKTIIDVGVFYSTERGQQFQNFMKINSFWPDLEENEDLQEKYEENLNENDNYLKYIGKDIKKNQNYLKLKSKVNLNSMSMILIHKQETFHVLNLKDIIVVIEDYPVYTLTKLEASSLVLIDSCKRQANHPITINNWIGKNRLKLEFKQFKDQNFINFHKYQTYCGIKLENLIITYIQRTCIELQIYLRMYLLAALDNQLSENDKKQIIVKAEGKLQGLEAFKEGLTQKINEEIKHIQDEENQEQGIKQASLFRFEVVVVKSIVMTYRNSIAWEGLSFSFSKLAYWFTGKWGNAPSELFETGLMSWERQIDYEQELETVYKSLSGDDKSQGSDMGDNDLFFETQGQNNYQFEEMNGDANIDQDEFSSIGEKPKSYDNGKQEQDFQEVQKVACMNMQLRTFESEEAKNAHILKPEDIFGETKEDTLSLDCTIQFEYENFIKNNPWCAKFNQELDPMKISVNIPYLKLHIFDTEYRILCKLFGELLGEQAQTVQPPSFTWKLQNYKIWMVLNFQVGKIEANIYKGQRSDLKEFIQNSAKSGKSQRKSLKQQMLEEKNEGSLGTMVMENIVYHFFMQENGSKIMKIYLGNLEISDNRVNSLIQEQKNKVLFFDFDPWLYHQEQSDLAQPEFQQQNRDFQKTIIEYSDSEVVVGSERQSSQNDSEESIIQYEKNGNGMEINLNQNIQNQNQNQSQDLDQDQKYQRIHQGENDKNRVQQQGINDEGQFIQEKFSNKKMLDLNHDRIRISRSRNKNQNPKQNKQKSNEKKDKQVGIWNAMKISLKRLCGCGKAYNKNDDSSDSDISFGSDMEMDEEDQQKRAWKEWEMDPQTGLAKWPQDTYPDRPYNIKHRKEVLPVTIKGNKRKTYQDLMQDYKRFDFLNKGDKEKCDLFMLFEARPDGERLIQIQLNEKNIIVLQDFWLEMVDFFRQPFNGSDFQEFQKMPPNLNNLPAMVVEIDINNLQLLLLGDLNDYSKTSLGILLDVNYKHEWSGDSFYGPGDCVISVDAIFKQAYTFPTNYIFEEDQEKQREEKKREQEAKMQEKEQNEMEEEVKKQQQKDKDEEESYEQNQFFILHNKHDFKSSLFSPFKVQFKKIYSLDFYRKDEPKFADNKYDLKQDAIYEARKREKDLKKINVKLQDQFQENEYQPKYSYNKMYIGIINSNYLDQNKNENHIAISLYNLKKIQDIVAVLQKPSQKQSNSNFKITRKDPQPAEFLDNQIYKVEIEIEDFRVALLKNSYGNKVARVLLQHFSLKQQVIDDETKMSVVGQIQFDYLNKRKNAMEPFLEPWVFQVKQLDNDKESNLDISNYKFKGHEPQYIKQQQNSLNLNITAPFLETVMEAKKTFYGDIDDAEPYLLYNKTGGYVIEIVSIKQKQEAIFLIDESQEQRVKDTKGKFLELDETFDGRFEWRGPPDNEQKCIVNCTLMTLDQFNQTSNGAFLTKNLMETSVFNENKSQSTLKNNSTKFQQLQQQQQLQQKNINLNQNQNQNQNLQQNSSAINLQDSVKQINQNDENIFKRENSLANFNKQPSEQFFNNNQQNLNGISSNQINLMKKDFYQSENEGGGKINSIFNEEALKNLKNNNNMQRNSNFNFNRQSSFNMLKSSVAKRVTGGNKQRSDFRPLKYGRIDQIGKQLFYLVKKDEQKVTTKQQGYLNKFIKDLKLTNNEKINDQDKVLFMYDIQIDPHTESKKVVLSSAVRILNELEETVEVQFKIKKRKEKQLDKLQQLQKVKKIQQQQQYLQNQDILSQQKNKNNSSQMSNNARVSIKKLNQEDKFRTISFQKIKPKEVFYVPLECLINQQDCYIAFKKAEQQHNNAKQLRNLNLNVENQKEKEESKQHQEDKNQQNQQQQNGQKFSDQDLQYYNLKDIIKDISSEVEYQKEDPIEYKDIFPENLQDNNQNKILIHKQDLDIQSYQRGNQEKCLKNESYSQQQMENNYYFALSTIKNKHVVSNSVDGETCYETVLSLRPYVSFRNALPRKIWIKYLENGKKYQQQQNQRENKYRFSDFIELLPGELSTCTSLAYSDEFSIVIKVDGFTSSLPVRVMNSNKQRQTLDLNLIHEKQYIGGGDLVVHLEVLSRSAHYKEICIYCPYLIMNESIFQLKLRSKGLIRNHYGFIETNIQPIDFEKKELQEVYEEKLNKMQNINFNKEDESIDSKKVNKYLKQDEQELIIKQKQEVWGNLHNFIMFNTQRDMPKKVQIALTDGGEKQKALEWSESIPLKNNDDSQVSLKKPNSKQKIGLNYQKLGNDKESLQKKKEYENQLKNEEKSEIQIYQKEQEKNSSNKIQEQNKKQGKKGAQNENLDLKSDPLVQKQIEENLSYEKVSDYRIDLNISISPASGIFSRSKIIKITPRFLIVNDSEFHIALSQKPLLNSIHQNTQNMILIKKGEKKYFNWPDSKGNNYVVASYFTEEKEKEEKQEEKDKKNKKNTGRRKLSGFMNNLFKQSTYGKSANMSIKNQENNSILNLIGWSEEFDIDQTMNFAINMKEPKNEKDKNFNQLQSLESENINENKNNNCQQDQDQDNFEEIQERLQKINISKEENVMVVRFMKQDLINPPFYIRNQTNYDIYYRQSLKNKGGRCCGLFSGKDNDGKQHMKQLYPKDIVPYTWDKWIVEGDHILEVDIEGNRGEYNIDKIKDYEPISLKRRNFQKSFNKKYMFKKGNLYLNEKIKIQGKQKTQEQFTCILDVYKQTLCLYTMQSKKLRTCVNLNGAKIEEGKHSEFIISKGGDSKYFQASNEDECQSWMEYAWRSVLVNTPDLVQFKIEPMNHTKVLTFYVSKFSQENMEEIVETGKNVHKNTTISLDLNNAIGISFVDCFPREILQVQLKNLKISRNVVEEIMLDTSKQEEDLEKEAYNASFLQNTTTNYQTQTISQVPNNTSLNNQQGSQMAKKKEKMNIQKKTVYSVQLEYLIINNQLKGAQFPVIFAPNTKRQEKGTPFININLIQTEVLNNSELKIKSKDDPEDIQSINSVIKYIQLFTVYTDSMEIRIDDYFIEALSIYTSQIMPKLQDNQKENRIIKYDFTYITDRIEDKSKENANSNKANEYIKTLKFEDINICLTFRSSPGHELKASIQNYMSNLGFMILSIDSAKIKLNSIQYNHLFGQMSDIQGRIMGHYKSEVLTSLYRIFGGMELLGNPANLIENLSTGVFEVFYDPIKALTSGKGGLKATASLIQALYKFIIKVMYNFYVTAITFMNNIMRLLAFLVFQKEYIYERQIRTNRHIKNMKDGFVIGFKNFFYTIWDAISGIILRPYYCSKDKGLVGFFQGLWQGLAGLAIKPVVGIYDLIVTISEGLINHSKYEESIMENRSRPPRLFGHNNVLIPFDYVSAVGMDIIRKYKLEEIPHESILHYEEIDDSFYQRRSVSLMVFTDIRLIYAKKHSLIDVHVLELAKVNKIIYKKRSNRLVFYTDVAINRGFCRKRKNNFSIQYSNFTRAKQFLATVKQHFEKEKLYDIEIRIEDKTGNNVELDYKSLTKNKQIKNKID